MEDSRDQLIVAGGAAVAVVLQIVLAPALAIGSGLPNFIMTYALVIAIVRPDNTGSMLPFVLGLVYDLLGNGPVGAMAFLLVLVSFLMSKAFSVLDNDSPFMPLVTIVVAAFAIEVLYGAFMIGVGIQADAVDMLAYRAIPCALFDMGAGVVLYIVMSRLLAGGSRAKFGQARF